MKKISFRRPALAVFLVFFLSAGWLASCSGSDSQAIRTEYPTVAEELDYSEDMTVWDHKELLEAKVFAPTPEWLIWVDLSVLILLMGAGIFMVFTRKSAKSVGILTLITLIYLGLIRGGCICPVGAVSNVAQGLVLPGAILGIATILLFILPLVVALIAGRVFCSAGCPLGAVQQIFYKKKKPVRIPSVVNKAIRIFPVLILAATVYYALTSCCYLICQLEPYKALFFTGQAWFESGVAFLAGRPMESTWLWAFGIGAWGYLIAVLLLGYWVPRPFCRLMCPYGVLLGTISLVSFRKRTINKESCIYCGQCQKICPTQAIVIDRKEKRATLSSYDCVQCNRCNGVCPKKAI